MRRPVRVLLAGVAVLLATLGPAASSSAQEPPPPLPSSIAAIGDSITQAFDACCFYGNWPRHSWSTGYDGDDGVASHYERIRAQNPAIRGHRHNNALSGAKMAAAPAQAQATVGQGAQYVTILMGANDLCDADGLTPTATFRAQFEQAIGILREGLPGSRVFVSSIPNLYQLWSLLHADPAAQLVWQTARICPPMLRITNSEADRQRVVQRELEFNQALREVCAGWASCRFDGGRTYGFQFTRAMVSRLDYFHPSLLGHATLAAETWQASWWGA
jgi:lysophospholipase L1-like esterase